MMAFKIGHLPWNKNRQLTKEHRDKISESRSGQKSIMKGKTKVNGLYPERCGFLKGHPHYTIKGDFKKGHKTWNTGTSVWLEVKCLFCGKTFKICQCHIKRKGRGQYCSKECAMRGSIPKSYRQIYKGIKMRSSWEVSYAKFLDKNKTKWEYEPKTFNLGNTKYTPDFYLPEKLSYVEIKGWMRPIALEKIKAFIKQNPDIKYLLLTEKELKAQGILKC